MFYDMCGVNLMLFSFGFVVGYATYKLLLTLSGKPIYTEEDFAEYGNQQYDKGYDQGKIEARW